MIICGHSDLGGGGGGGGGGLSKLCEFFLVPPHVGKLQAHFRDSFGVSGVF